MNDAKTLEEVFMNDVNVTRIMLNDVNDNVNVSDIIMLIKVYNNVNVSDNVDKCEQNVNM